jgi:hypothetical protein
MIYGDLIEQYKNLDESEAHALLIYKSRLSRAINSLDIDDEEVMEAYNTYKEYLENPSNIFMKMTVFKDIDFSDISSFKNSLELVKKKIKDASLKMRLKDDLTVYRALSVSKDDSVSFISRSDIISTSTSFDECSKFIIPDSNYKHTLYQINLEKDSPVLICPYSILIKDGVLSLTQRHDQKEIILLKDNYDFTEVLSTDAKLNDLDNINIVLLDAEVSDRIKKDSRVNKM